jgi:flagellar biosynthesis protein FlhG
MKHAPIRVSIGGGKGGVGKSVVAANLACALAALGLRTVLVDGDLGAPNLHTLLGVTNVGPTLHALLERRISRLEEALVGTEIPRLSLVAGASGVPGHANPSHQEKLKLLRQIASLDADAVVIDVGAGTSYNALDLFTAGQVRLIVATPELTSLQNAYVFSKAVVLREIAALAKSEGKLEAWAKAIDHGETSRMSRWLGRLEGTDAVLAARIRRYLAAPGTALVGNRIGAPSERHALFALSRLGREFLDVELPIVATLPSSQSVLDSVQRRRPVVFGAQADAALARAFSRLAEHVVTSERGARDAGPVEALGVEPPPEDWRATRGVRVSARRPAAARGTCDRVARVRRARATRTRRGRRRRPLPRWCPRRLRARGACRRSRRDLRRAGEPRGHARRDRPACRARFLRPRPRAGLRGSCPASDLTRGAEPRVGAVRFA